MIARLSTHAIVNIVLAVVAVGLVGAALYLESTDAAATTTTTSTTTTTTTTTTIPPTTTSTTTTSTTSTTTTTTIPPTTVPPPPRDFLPMLVVNGSNVGERLDPMIELLRELGYEEIRGVTGAVLAPTTKIYVAEDDFRNAGDVLAIDIGLTPDDVLLFDDAPPVAGIGNALMILYLGGS